MLKTVIILLVGVALAFVLNPGPEAHRDKLKSEIAARNQLAGVLQIGALAAFASTYHTLGVASYTTLNERRVTFGAFGIVFVPDLGTN
ncbi:conserved hypothetical protein [Rubrivivax sp. A210]|uniref:hypothetical protein n=1 Tax=Rubrivivax sp. A210 TaxID=2772301 RepID=UPI0019185B3C|nr:hypothetical protein [Rubrivivax sp. A210]CAD5374124.1 conserved hypothetical protein [Rubrivivax sp. A210]